MNRTENHITLLDAANSTWVGQGKNSTDFWNIVFSLSTTGTSSFTVKFQWSTSSIMPDFSAAQSATNMWTYMEVIDLENGWSTAWKTGITVASAVEFKNLVANVDWMKFINASVTAYSAWAVTIKGYLFSN